MCKLQENQFAVFVSKKLKINNYLKINIAAINIALIVKFIEK